MSLTFKTSSSVIEDKLFFLIGLTSTWTAIQIPIFGIQISIFNIIIIIAWIYHFIITRKKVVYIHKVSFVLFLLGTLISCFSSLIFLNNYWFSESFKATTKFLIVYLPLFCLFRKQELKKLGSSFYIGLYYSCIVQLIWSFLQLIFWYGMNRVLNQEIFGDLLHIQTSHSWLTWHSGFRTTGISWESANLGISLAMGFFLSRNIWMKLLFFVGMIFCGSRSALFALIFGIFIATFYQWIHGNCIKIAYNRRNEKNILIFLCLIMSFFLLLNLFSFDLSLFIDTIQSFTNRIINGFSGDDASAGRHIDYYLKIPQVVSKSNVLQIIFGYGTSNSGYPYTEIFNESSDPTYVWNVESDFITLLVGNGLFGFVTYYAFSFQMIFHNRKNSLERFAASICIIFAGIMYLYVRTWVTLVIIFMAIDASFPGYQVFAFSRIKKHKILSDY